MKIDIKKSTYHELLDEYEKCEELWRRYSCDCFGFYISAILSEITKRGGFPPKN